VIIPTNEASIANLIRGNRDFILIASFVIATRSGSFGELLPMSQAIQKQVI
jgi:hypothetical protein